MTLTEYYMTRNVGETINNDDVNMYLVWIPRYKYRVWNVLGNNESSYNAYQNGIDIVFENSNKSTGEITCKNNICTIDDTPVTVTDNNKYYTHPAFKNISEEVTGFWVSKYEITTSGDNCNENSQSGCTLSTLPIESKPNASVWRNNYLSNYYKAINRLKDYQIIQNTEWGAIAYLTNSKYGICKTNNCQELGYNNTYISGSNKNDTTTFNNYGIYDMAGGAMEYTMSNYTANGKLNDLFKDTTISNNDYELYPIDTFLLGDATNEIITNGDLWYGNTYEYLNSSDKWIVRGGDSKEYKGLFAFTTITDSINDNITTRLVLK